MSEILPTVKVKHKKYGIEMVINEKDFDKEVHELLDKKSKATVKAEEEAKKKVAEEAKKKAEEEEAAKLQALMGGK